MASLAQVPGAWACASCGSGGDDPLVLSPNEDFKVLLGAGRMSGFGYIKHDGSSGQAVAPRARDSVMLALGKAVGPRAFVSVGMPAVRNEGDSATIWGLGDLFVAARYTLLQPSITAPWWPQLQLLTAFRNATSASIYDAQRPDLLDAFGTGFDEGRLGADVWFGMFPWRFGGAVMGLWPFARPTSGGLIRPGAALRTVLTGGYGLSGLGQLLVSWTRDAQGMLLQDGTVIPGSDRLVHGFGASLEATLTESATLRLSVARIAAMGSRNAMQSTTVGLACMRSW